MNRRRFMQLAGGAALVTKLKAASREADSDGLQLWYDKPAANWDEALPIGSGRFGAMIFGGVESELLQLNEDTLYSEEPGTGNLPLDITRDFAQVEALLGRGDYAEAGDLITKHWTGRSWPCYQPMADLYVSFSGHGATPLHYRRELNLDTATSRVEYVLDGVSFTREYFASFPDQVIVAHLKSSRAGALRLRAGLRSPHPTAKATAVSDRGIELRGQAPGFVLRRTLEWVEARGEQGKYPELWDSEGKRRPFAKQVLYGDEVGGRGMYFATRMEAKVQGGKAEIKDGEIVIEGARELTLILSAATSYNGFLKSPSKQGVDPSAQAARVHVLAGSQTFDSLRGRHVKDYQSLFRRVTIDLSSAKASSVAAKRPTDQRIARFHEGEDSDFAALYLQFARYLTIAGSRPGSQPLNLQGMWNREVIPPWACGYTTNINLQMNYWPVDTLNLSECFEPLERLIAEAATTGAATARSMYKRRGWVLHHNTSLWRGTQPVDNNAMPAFWPMGAGWLCEHLWEHYLFTGNLTFLRRTYPLIKGAAEFFIDWLVEDQDGHLVTPVGVSPENLFAYTARDGSSRTAGVSSGPTMDIAITRQVFRNCIAAAETLGVDQDFRANLSARMKRLLPYKIGKHGQLQEWAIDFEEVQRNHRHVSHLYGLYPDSQITTQTPELMRAVQRSLELRGDEGTGWSRAWKICLWARLQDGNHAYRLVNNLFTPAKNGTVDSEQGGLMPNMFCSCPPMQIDGNFGGAAGIVEMLLQSRNGCVHLLPALPDAWSDGSFTGFRTRANCVVSAEWRDGKLLWADLLSSAHRTIDVLYAEKKLTVTLEPGKSLRMFSNEGQPQSEKPNGSR